MILSPTLAFAHGENKPGPHGGFVRMPGAFHTEISVDGKNKLKVYLLDLEWKNPSVNKSSVQITHNNKTKANCLARDKYFECNFSKNIDLTKTGELRLNAVREEQKGNEVTYELPLKLDKEIIENKVDHSEHK